MTAATLEYVDPNQLTLGVNIRHDEKLHQPFVDSIKSRGVLEPVLAHFDPESGGIVVDQGQRRTLAAVRAGLDSIPVLIRDTPPDEEARLVDQWTENEHRASLSNAERVGAVEQLALLGLPVDLIAKRLSAPYDEVLHATAIAKSATARQHVDGVTLDQAAAIAEFEDDPEAVERIVDIINRGFNVDHQIERVRQDRAAKQALAARELELTEAGLRVIPKPNWDDKTTASLDDLRNGRKKIDIGFHAIDCPGHVVWVHHSWAGQERELVTTSGCQGWAKHGHRAADGTSAAAKIPAADQTDEERAQAAKERRHVIDSNKAWKAATTVRRRWLTDFARAKTAPTGAEVLIAAGIVGGWCADISRWSPSATAFGLLGGNRETFTSELATAGPKRALQIALAITVAAWDASTHDGTWRDLEPVHGRVLAAISQWGYELSEIEQRMIDGTAAVAQ